MKIDRTDSYHFHVDAVAGRVEGVAWSDGLIALDVDSAQAEVESTSVRSTADLARLLESVEVAGAERVAEELWVGGLGEFADRYWSPNSASP